MKIKQLNKEKNFTYSRWGKSFELTFKHSGLGLHLSFEIFKIKTNSDNYQEFLDNFYFPKPDSDLPRFLPLDIEVFKQSFAETLKPEAEKPAKIYSLDMCIDSITKENNPLTIITGESGSGKTATFLAIANQCTRKNSTLFKNNFIPCLINFGNEKNTNEIILNTLRANINIQDMDKFLEFSPPLLFFIDLNAIQRSIISETRNKNSETIIFENRLNDSDLIEVILEIRNKIEKVNRYSGNKHRLFVLTRPGNISSLYEKIKDYGITWKLKSLNLSDSINYIKDVGKEQAESIKAIIPRKNMDFLTTPIFIDFINWLALKSETDLKDIKIFSLADFYLIFTREFLRNEYKQWKKNGLFSWTEYEENRNRILEFDEKKFSGIYTNGKLYSLEEEPNPIELILMIIARELGSNFIDTSLRKLLEKIILNTDYMWLDNYREIQDKTELNKRINTRNIIGYTLLKYENETDVVFFHQSISDFYHAKSIFYDLEKGNLVNIDDKNHFIKQLNKCKKFEVFQFFIELFEKQLQFSKEMSDKSCFDILSSLDLNDESFFFLGKVYLRKKEKDKEKILYKKSIQKNPGNVKAHNNLGLIYKNERKYDKAETEFRKALQYDPKYYFSQFNLGETLYYKNAFSEAIVEMKKAIEIEPNDFDSYFILSDSYSAIGKHSEIINTIENIPETCVKEKGMVDFLLGKANFEKGDIEKAVIHYKKSIEDSEIKEVSYVNLGLIYLNEGNINESIEMFQKAIDLEPTLGIAYSNLGLAYLKKGDSDKAIEIYLKGIEIIPDVDIIHNNLGLAYNNLGKYKEAVSEFLKAIELNPNIELTYINLANIYSLQGKITEAISQYNKALKINPDCVSAYIQMGRIYSEQLLFDKAIEQFNIALKIQEKNIGKLNILGLNTSHDVFTYALNNDRVSMSEIYLGLLNCYSEKGDFEETSKYFEKALEYAPDNERVYALLGDQYMNHGQTDDCINIFNDGLKHFPDSEILNCFAGDVYLYLNNPEKALSFYQTALEKHPRSLHALCGISDINSAKGNYKESISILKTALEVEPNYRPALVRICDLLIVHGKIPETIISFFRFYKVIIMEKTNFSLLFKTFILYSYKIILKILKIHPKRL